MKVSGRFRCCEVCLVLLLLVLPASGAAAGPAHLVADLDPEIAAFDPQQTHSFYSYTAVNGRVVFFSQFPVGSPPLNQAQCGLWEVDPVSGAAEQLASVCDGEGDFFSPRLRMIATTGAVAFFSDASGRLWRTDGTAAGTFPLGRVQVGGYGPPALGPDGRTLFFSGCLPDTGCEPWRSDGTRRGTSLLRDLAPGPESSNPWSFTAAQGRVLVSAGDGIWSTDGTAAGTVRLVQIPGTEIRQMLAQGSLVYFEADRGSSAEVWALHPATGTARLLKRFYYILPSAGVFLRAVGGRVLLEEFDSSNDIYALWETDGTPAGTRPIGPPYMFLSGSSNLFAVGGRIVFAAESRGSSQPRLWALDPGSRKPRLLRGCAGGCPVVDNDNPLDSAVVFAGRLYFSVRGGQHCSEIWSTDGTGPGTRLSADLCTGDGAEVPLRVALGRLLFSEGSGQLWVLGGPEGITPFAQEGTPFAPLDLAETGGRIVFTGLDPASGPQPFISDLTPAGTRPLTRIGGLLAASSQPSFLTALGGKALFSACDGQTSGLWASDGTAGGTVRLPGTEDSCPSSSTLMIFPQIGGLAFFDFKSQLWRTDGTPGGTVPLLDLQPDSYLTGEAPLGNRLLFPIGPPSFPPSDNGWIWTFWTSDGTPAGTQPAFPLRLSSTPRLFTAAGGLVFFKAQEPDSPYPDAIWRTDGTEAGTFPILEGLMEDTSQPLEIVPLGGKLYFLAGTSTEAGAELWMTDGTAAGTAPVPLPAAGPRHLLSLVAFQGALYFYTWSGDSSHPAGELWRSDGTAAGTRLLKTLDLPRSPLSSNGFLPPQLTPAGGQLCFRADDGVHGAELWKTDGTPEGTVLVKDIAPGPFGSHPDDLTAAGGRLYFAATDGVHGTELWQSDGTAAGTTLVQDVLPGPAPSSPEQLTAADGTLYFTADDGEHGRELWALPLPR